MKCAFCKYSKLYEADTEAEFVIDGISVCAEHVDNAVGPNSFDTKLRLHEATS